MEKSFLPYLFQRDTNKFSTRGTTYLSVKQVGLENPNPTLSAEEKCTASCVITGHLIADLWGRKEFKTRDHVIFLQEGSREIQHRHVNNTQAAIEEATGAAHTLDAHTLK